VAKSVPNPSLDTLAFPFSSQKSLLHFSWGELAREHPVVPPPMAPGSVSVLVPACAGVDSGWCQLNGSVAAGVYFIHVEELLREWERSSGSRKTKQIKLMSQGSTGKTQSSKET